MIFCELFLLSKMNCAPRVSSSGQIMLVALLPFAGLRGTKVRGGSFPTGYELLGQIFSGYAHQKV